MKSICEIWNIAYEKMLERYGEQVPWQILNRFEQERLMLSYSGLQMLDFLSHLQKAAHETKSPVILSGAYPSSFIGFLLGTSEINPLPAHYVCPKCGRVEFVDSARDGFDLPEKKCSCGSELVGDGHNIPIEALSRQVMYRAIAECYVTTEFFDVAKRIIHDSWDKCYSVVPMQIDDDPMQLDNGEERLVFVLCPLGQAPKTDSDGILRLSDEIYFHSYDGYPHVALRHSKLTDQLETAWHRVGRLPSPNEFCEEKNLRAWISKKTKANELLTATKNGTLEVALNSYPIHFSTLVQVQGFLHGTDCWENNGEKLVEQGVDIMDIPSDRESIFLHITKKHPQAQGLASRVMEMAYKGKFARHGMSHETKNALNSMGMEQWFVDCCSRAKYLLPKAHSIEFLRQELMLKWLERSDDEKKQ